MARHGVLAVPQNGVGFHVVPVHPDRGVPVETRAGAAQLEHPIALAATPEVAAAVLAAEQHGLELRVHVLAIGGEVQRFEAARAQVHPPDAVVVRAVPETFGIIHQLGEPHVLPVRHAQGIHGKRPRIEEQQHGWYGDHHLVPLLPVHHRVFLQGPVAGWHG